MVHILQKVPGFGERLGAALGGGLGGGFQEGMNKAQDFANQMRLEEKKVGLKQKEENKNISDTFNPILDKMEDMIDYVGPFNIKALNPYSETAGKRARIDEMRLSLEGLFRDLTLKGQFPKAIYERILDKLPGSTDSPQQYREKIGGLRDILEAHSPERKEEGKKEKKAKKQNLTPEVIDSFLDEANGDIKQAKKLAADRGYTW